MRIDWFHNIFHYGNWRALHHLACRLSLSVLPGLSFCHSACCSWPYTTEQLPTYCKPSCKLVAMCKCVRNLFLLLNPWELSHILASWEVYSPRMWKWNVTMHTMVWNLTTWNPKPLSCCIYTAVLKLLSSISIITECLFGGFLSHFLEL